MASDLFYLPSQLVTGKLGLPAGAASVFFYYTGTTNKAPTYSDAGLSLPANNPAIADAFGKIDATYLDSGITYRIRIVDARGQQVGADVDPYIPGSITGLISVDKSSGYVYSVDANGNPVLTDLPATIQLPSQVASDGQTAFTFAGLNNDFIDVQVNGIAFSSDTYTVNGAIITFNSPRSAGDLIQPSVLSGVAAALKFQLATPTAPGLMTQTDKIKSDGIVDMKSIGAVFDGSYDNKQRFIDAFSELPKGGVVDLGHYGNLYTSDDISPPKNTLIKGQFYPGKPRQSWNFLDTSPSCLLLEPGKTLNLDGSKVENVLFWQANINQNPQTPDAFYAELAKFDGNAVTATGDDPAIHQCMMIGFARAGLIANVFRPEVTENVFDCLGGFDVSAAYDFRGRGISNNLGQAVYIQYKPWPIAVTRRPGKAIYVHDVADGVLVWQNMSYGYQAGLHLKDVFEVKASHIADGVGLPDPASAVGTRGIWLEGNLNGCNITNSGAHGQETGWYIDTTGITQLGNNTAGVSVKNQIYLGANSRGNLGNMLIGGTCDTPIAYAAGIADGAWHGNIDCWSSATSGNAIFAFNLADRNALRDVTRRYFDGGTALTDAFPMIYGDYIWGTRPTNPVKNQAAIFRDSNTATFGAPITSGGGTNVVLAHYVDGGWRVG